MEVNEEVQQKMLEYLQTFEQGIKKAGEFSAEQAPLVVQEFLQWVIVSNVVLGILAGGLLLLSVSIAIRYHWKLEGEDKAFLWLFAAVPIIAFGIAFVTCGERAGKAWIAPRIVVLEKISTLVK